MQNPNKPIRTTRVSEIFASFQGEAERAGMPSVWVRFFSCNLECGGFSQKFPKEPDKWEKNEDVDFSVIKRMEDVPIPKFGCDSSYSWSSRFKHLTLDLTTDQIADKILEVGQQKLSLDQFTWTNTQTKQPIQLCFTGGEPMLQQKAMIEIMDRLFQKGALKYVTIETNGTKDVSKEFYEYIWRKNINLNSAISPKLLSVSGEAHAVLPEKIKQYLRTSTSGAIKFVVNSGRECWAEIDSYMAELSNYIPNVYTRWRFWAMPVGATAEQQGGEELEKIVNEALRRGFYIATRNHITAFGNKPGT